jgi:hypothetical protein
MSLNLITRTGRTGHLKRREEDDIRRELEKRAGVPPVDEREIDGLEPRAAGHKIDPPFAVVVDTGRDRASRLSLFPFVTKVPLTERFDRLSEKRARLTAFSCRYARNFCWFMTVTDHHRRPHWPRFPAVMKRNYIYDHILNQFQIKA